MNVKIMSLPRRSGTSWDGGVSPNASAFAVFANSRSSRRVSCTASARLRASAIVCSEAIGTPSMRRPSTVQVIHTMLRTSSVRPVVWRCRASSSLSRTTASAIRTTRTAISATAPISTAVVPLLPRVSFRYDLASPSSTQSMTMSKRRPRNS